MPKRVWRITGRESLKVIFRQDVPSHHLSERQVEVMLARLAARHLTDEEVVASSLGRKAPSRLHHLEVQKNGGRHPFFTTGDTHYTARIVELSDT